MRIPRKLVVLAAPAVIVAALGSGVAYAATPAPAVTHGAPAAGTSSGPRAGVADKPDATEKPGATETATENSTAETAHEADGPGGHADTGGGNVDHEFNGTE